MIEQRWVLFLLGWALVAALQGALYLHQRRTRDATLVDAGWAFSLALLAVAVRAAGAGRGRAPRARCGHRLRRVAPHRMARRPADRARRGHPLRRAPHALARARPRAGELRRLLPGAGVPRRAPLAPVPARGLQRERRARAARVGRRRAVGRRSGSGGGRRSPARRLQGAPGQQGEDDARGPLALLAAPELLLPVAHVGRLRADRARRALRLARPERADPHAPPHRLRHRDPAVRGAGARSRGDDYRRYQRETSAFVPLPPRSSG